MLVHLLKRTPLHSDDTIVETYGESEYVADAQVKGKTVFRKAEGSL